MSTIAWRDAAYTEASGPVRFRNLTVHIGPQHVAQWKDDPDGRFGVKPSTVDPTKAELGRFFPSL